MPAAATNAARAAPFTRAPRDALLLLRRARACGSSGTRRELMTGAVVAAAAARAAAAAADSDGNAVGAKAQTVHLIRHGVTEMNVFLSTNAWNRRASPRKRRGRCGAPLAAGCVVRWRLVVT
jgi:hypothetical protein